MRRRFGVNACSVEAPGPVCRTPSRVTCDVLHKVRGTSDAVLLCNSWSSGGEKGPPGHARPRRRHADPNGFTVVEILIALALVGLLSAIAIPQLLGAREKALREKCEEHRHALDGELVLEAASWYEYPERRASLPPRLPTNAPLNLIATIHVAERHLEPNALRDAQAPPCSSTGNFFVGNPNCAFAVTLDFEQMPRRCQVALLPLPGTDSVFLIHRNYEDVLAGHLVDLAR
jgi:prepilin-type N-terminal cleavage/methylation domain-containing protein